MTRPSTDVRDAKIMQLWKVGMVPKMIAFQLKLANVNIVYDALRRDRRRSPDPRSMPRGRDRRMV